MKVNDPSPKMNNSETAKTEHLATTDIKKETNQSSVSDTSRPSQALRQQSQQTQRAKNRATKAILDATQSRASAQTTNVASSGKTSSTKQAMSPAIEAKTQTNVSINTSQNAILNMLKEVPLSEKLMHIIAKSIVQEAYNKGDFIPPIHNTHTVKTSQLNTRQSPQSEIENSAQQIKVEITDKNNTQSNDKASNTVRVNTKIAQYQNMLHSATPTNATKTSSEEPTQTGEIKTQAEQPAITRTQLTKATLASKSNQQPNVSHAPVLDNRSNTTEQADEMEIPPLTTKQAPSISTKKDIHTMVDLPPVQKTRLVKKEAIPEHETQRVLKKILKEMPSPTNNTVKTGSSEGLDLTILEQKVSQLISDIKDKQEDFQSQKLIKQDAFIQQPTQETLKTDSAQQAHIKDKTQHIIQNSSINTAPNIVRSPPIEDVFGINREGLLSIAMGMLGDTKTSPSQEGLISLLHALQLPTQSTAHISQWIKHRPDNQAIARALEQIQLSQSQDMSFISESLSEEGKAIVRLLAEQRVGELRQNPEQNMSFSLPNPQNPEKPIQLSIRRGAATSKDEQAHRERWNISLNFDLGKRGLLQIAALWEKKELSLNIKSDSHQLLYQARSQIGIVEQHLSALGIKQKGAHFQLLPVKSESRQEDSNESGLHIQI